MQTLPIVDVGGIWHITYFLGLGAFVAYLSLNWFKEVPISARLFWGYVLLYSLFLVVWPTVHFGPYTPNFQVTAAQVFIEALVVPITAVCFPTLIIKVLPFIALFSAACADFNFGGLMHAPSFNMALAVLCIPLITSTPIIIFVVASALTHHGSTALLMLAAQLVTLIAFKKVSKKWLFIFVPIAIASAYFHQNQAWFNSGERIQKWVEYLHFWVQDPKRILLGVGPGSFIWYSIMNHPYQTGFYLQMHSDWLQVLWELGIVGFIFEVWVTIVAVKKAKDSPIVLSGVLSCVVFGLTYQPLRYYPTALLTALYFLTAFSYKKR